MKFFAFTLALLSGIGMTSAAALQKPVNGLEERQGCVWLTCCNAGGRRLPPACYPGFCDAGFRDCSAGR
ncbi:uncharacterized protein RCC_10308 [Ramularia collo-cygni]|uniref:Chitin-binding type-1 domain-containing protein n=1 Tax=Ramularia collo-cygni TaxID=112498 RepID=A0A2D3V989_9PEZI|nr:uncharacterized protein RCC_10308 [Ramularia collo-cygni]CZT24583.1 uncharacterized protein RCC_10308 [Ramularia collo-cygni]